MADPLVVVRLGTLLACIRDQVRDVLADTIDPAEEEPPTVDCLPGREIVEADGLLRQLGMAGSADQLTTLLGEAVWDRLGQGTTIRDAITDRALRGLFGGRVARLLRYVEALSDDLARAYPGLKAPSQVSGSTPSACPAQPEPGEGSGGGGTTPTEAKPDKGEGDDEGLQPAQDGRFISVEKWSDLAIGIDADHQYLAISPPPERYAVFPRDKAVPLTLPGKRWKLLLDLLARSSEGNRAEKSDVMSAFGYLQTDELAKSRSLLTSAMADLGRDLRRQVKGPVEKGVPAVLSVAEDKYVKAGFVVRHLVRGHDGKLRFGEEAPGC